MAVAAQRVGFLPCSSQLGFNPQHSIFLSTTGYNPKTENERERRVEGWSLQGIRKYNKEKGKNALRHKLFKKKQNKTLNKEIKKYWPRVIA